MTYLALSVRATNDLTGAAQTMNAFLARPDLWPQLQAEVNAWTVSLNQWRKQPVDYSALPPKGVLSKMETLLAGATDGSPARHHLIDYLVASRVLAEFLDTSPHSPPRAPDDRARANYLLGLAEIATFDDHWLNLSEWNLEAAVRAAPHTPTSRAAFDLLERRITLRYSGSAGTHIPDDVQSALDDLEALR